MGREIWIHNLLQGKEVCLSYARLAIILQAWDWIVSFCIWKTTLCISLLLAFPLLVTAGLRLYRSTATTLDEGLSLDEPPLALNTPDCIALRSHLKNSYSVIVSAMLTCGIAPPPLWDELAPFVLLFLFERKLLFTWKLGLWVFAGHLIPWQMNYSVVSYILPSVQTYAYGASNLCSNPYKKCVEWLFKPSTASLSLTEIIVAILKPSCLGFCSLCPSPLMKITTLLARYSSWFFMTAIVISLKMSGARDENAMLSILLWSTLKPMEIICSSSLLTSSCLLLQSI